MKTVLNVIACLFIALIVFAACDKNNSDDNYDFSCTSWESEMDTDDVSGTLILSFTDDKNGIVRGDLQGKDGQKYTTFHSFTYEAEMDKGTLHVICQQYIMGKFVSKLFTGQELTFSLDRKAKTLELSNQEDVQTYTATGYKSISLPVSDTPEEGNTDIKLTRDMLLGTWVNFFKMSYDCKFSFYGDFPYLGAITVDCVLGKLRSKWIHETAFHYTIENGNTVVYPDTQDTGKAKYKLEFYDAATNPDYIMYLVRLYDADGNEILKECIVDPKYIPET